MKKEHLEILQKLSPNFSEEKIVIIIENHFIKKYGSRENAINYFKENNKVPQKEFIKEFDQKSLKKFSEAIFESDSLTDLLNNISNLKNDSTLDEGNLLINLESIKSLEPELTNTLDLTESRIQVSLIPFLEEKLKLSLKKTREELGYPDSRTFNKWLSVFFNDKFANRGENNGRITLQEYIEIVSAFMLSYDEASFGNVKPEELVDRFNNHRSIHKKELKNLTNNNYSLLNKLLEEINIDEDLNLPENYRKFPYKIATILTKEIERRL